jgi:hypothetical protein
MTERTAFMDLNKNKPGGGSGGDPNDPVYEDHDDVTFVDGKFKRVADKIILQTQHDEGQEETHIAVLASGEKGQIHVQGGQLVNVVAGLLGDEVLPDLKKPGVTLFSNDLATAPIRLQLGYFDNPDTRSITMSAKGIVVDAGISGTITLQAGPDGASSIVIAPDGITMKGTTININ